MRYAARHANLSTRAADTVVCRPEQIAHVLEREQAAFDDAQLEGVLQDEGAEAFVRAPASLFPSYCAPAVEESVVTGQYGDNRRARVQVVDDGSRSLDVQSETAKNDKAFLRCCSSALLNSHSYLWSTVSNGYRRMSATRQPTKREVSSRSLASIELISFDTAPWRKRRK